MVTFECPWCAEPAVIDATFAELECEHCVVSVQIAADPVTTLFEHAA